MTDDSKKFDLPALKKAGKTDIAKKAAKLAIPPLDLEKKAAVSDILDAKEETLRQKINQREKGLDLVLVGDLTGSMVEYHNLLKNEFSSLSGELFQLIENLRIAIIFYLDHDHFHPYLTRVCPLGKDIQKMQNFISSTPVSGGGDFDEAVEDAFYDIVNLNWRESGNRSVVLFGDARAHEPENCPNQHSYFDLVKKMHDKKIFVNSVYCGRGFSADTLQKLEDVEVGNFDKRVSNLDHPNFFSWVANVTGGMIIDVGQIEELIEIIKASAAKDSGDFEKYEESLKLTREPAKLKLLEVVKKADRRQRLAHQKNEKRLGYK